MSAKDVFYQGNEACAEGALYAGCRFFAGYPITPSTEVAEFLARRGKKSLTATSGPGYSLKMENLGFACLTEVPCVIVNVMRGGPSTGLPTGPRSGDLHRNCEGI
jgi:2-oxoglutarate ferredoxin oxidoreductase subunit alpha